MVGDGDFSRDFVRDFVRDCVRDVARDDERDVVRGAVVEGGSSSVVGGGEGTAIVGTDGVVVDDASEVSLDIQSSHSLVALGTSEVLGGDVVGIQYSNVINDNETGMNVIQHNRKRMRDNHLKKEKEIMKKVFKKTRGIGAHRYPLTPSFHLRNHRPQTRLQIRNRNRLTGRCRTRRGCRSRVGRRRTRRRIRRCLAR